MATFDPNNIPLGVFSLEAAEIISEAIEGNAGTPAGATGDIQFNNNGAFGNGNSISAGIIATAAGGGVDLIASQASGGIGLGAGPTSNNVIAIEPSLVEITALETGAQLQFISDNNMSFTSNNGTMSFGGGTSAALSANGRVFLSGTRANVALSSVSIFANNAAAVAGGLIQGDLYRTGANPDLLCIVH